MRLHPPLRVLNTRTASSAPALSQALHDRGLISIELPLLDIQTTPDAWLAQLPLLDSVQQAIFISPNAVSSFFDKINPSTWPKTIHTIVIGLGTKIALEQQGITVHDIPSIADSTHLLQLNTLQSIQHQSILLIKGMGGLPLIEETLRQRQANVITLAVYQRVQPHYPQEKLNRLWRDDGIDMIIITSEQAMMHLFALFGPDAGSWLCSKPFIVISKRLASVAEHYGIKHILISDYKSLMITLEHYILEKSLHG